jgi:hypothetical protein
MKPAEFLNQIIEVHGGNARWQNVDTIEAAFSSGGLAFSLHLQPLALRGLRLSLRPHARHLVLHDYCRKGWSGVWKPTEVRILDANGELIAERCNPRAFFSGLDRQFRWDKLDLLYFAGYALWNYLSFPFILLEPGVALVEPESESKVVPGLLQARFGPEVPTHSANQSFHLDESGQLIRHDYTADVIGRWAKAANFCLASEQIGGLRFYTRRKVYPSIGEWAVLPWPTLVWIEIDGIRLTLADGSVMTGA